MEIKITVSDNLTKAIEHFADALVAFTSLNNRGENISFSEIKEETPKPSEKSSGPKPIETTQDVEATTESPVETSINEEDIRAKFLDLNKKGKKAELKDVLNALGVEKVSSLKPDQFKEAMTKLEAIA